ncbi:SRPBCC family protein [Lacisediminihabitans sp. FW035]
MRDIDTGAGRELRMRHTIAAPREQVWVAWTTTAGLARWWWNHWPDVEIEADVRVGGSYRFVAPAAGIVVSGIYLAVDAPSRLVITWVWSDPDGVQGEEAVEVRFSDSDASTAVSIVHRGPWDDDTAATAYREGWTFVLLALERELLSAVRELKAKTDTRGPTGSQIICW